MIKNNHVFALPTGTILNGGQHPYRIEKVLGQGGYGITYKVSANIMQGNIPLTVFFAVKEHFVKGHCYRGEDGTTMEYSKASKEEVEESLRNFKKEANRLKEICRGNKNVVNVNEVFFSNNTAYYVMEYIDGGNLRQLVHDHKGCLSEQEALSIIIPIANAVSYVHKQGIMHLDIKPDNIVIRENTKEPVLIDFGVSLHFDKKGELTTTHASTGTSVGFAPQEQFAGITHFSPEVDVYALAATLFYLLVGRDPISSFDIKPGYVEESLPGTVSQRTREAIVNGMKSKGYERTQTAEIFVAGLVEQETMWANSTDDSLQTQKIENQQTSSNSLAKSEKTKIGIGIAVVFLAILFFVFRGNTNNVTDSESKWILADYSKKYPNDILAEYCDRMNKKVPFYLFNEKEGSYIDKVQQLFYDGKNIRFLIADRPNAQFDITEKNDFKYTSSSIITHSYMLGKDVIEALISKGGTVQFDYYTDPESPDKIDYSFY